MYIMETEPISTAYFINPSHQSVCLCVYPSIAARQQLVKCIPPSGAKQRLGKHVPTVTNTRNNRGAVGGVTFYAVRVLSKESLWVCLCISLPLLGNNSVKTFPRERKNCWRSFLCGPCRIKGTSCYLTALSVSGLRVYSVGWWDWWIMNWKGFGRKRWWPKGIIQLAPRDWEKSRKTSVRIAGVPAEIRTEHLPNGTQEL
jgi:hypothetical protein